ncbi:ATP-binding protein [Nonomuraea aridisoli]|uniref:LuxR family transcriptional regulator n=1 Tax=Nonomuraea aridisoli TaxID=2070368 RepID=A0A2W2E1G0_9ACTN|nr:helix-turn-helix transcriptional regulator [Nonomuraea aridisoli]PZG16141.1 LuxR family transcriptional regulator [Nonomuraea aridisoli]
MLYGREAEIAAIDELISRARDGAGGALVLRGEAGVGKTALLDLAASRGGPMPVLGATGVEAESDLAFAALHQALRPVAGLLDALPEPQREAVRGALGLAGSGDRFLLAAGVLSLLAEAAAPEGLVCVVDDFQWVDRASADALLFAARRLGTERIAMLLAVRGDLPVKGVPSLEVGGLPEPAAAELLDAGATIAAGVKQRLVALTAGNPLALRETVRRLSPAQLDGREPLPDPLPGGSRLFGEQVTALPDEARQVALLAALDGDLGLVSRAAARLGVGREALDELEAAGLARVTGASVRFRHPLVRSAVYESATPAVRRDAHAMLAAVADEGAGERAEGGAEGDRRAWHLAAAALGPDEAVAGALARAAARARDCGGYGDSATALTRAAELTPDPLIRAARLKDAAVAAWLGGLPGRAESLLAEAREHAGNDAALGTEIAQLRGRLELNSGSAAEAVRVLSAGGSLGMLADASEAASYVGDTAAMIEIGRRAEAYPEGFLRDVVAGIGAALSGRDDGPELLRRALARTGELREAAEFLWATAAASYLGEADLSAELAARAGRVARVSGMTGQLPVVLEFVATAERIAGRPAESRAISEEGLELAREAGYANTVAAHLANLAVCAALRGEEETCRRHAQEALAIALPHRVGLRASVAAYALGMLDLGLGRYAAAHDRFTALVAAGPGAGHPTTVWRSTPDRIEAAVGAGDLESARTALQAYEQWSAHAATAESRALLARCRALVSPSEEDAQEGFAEALRLHANPYEAARTGLLLGERLRRAHRPAEARPHLRAALEAFRQAGAEPWARRAHAELRAAGESGEAPAGSALDALTPQELRIAGLVADGLSSKEIAARLFLSPRTVEYHLYKIYPKLGIGTRTELARLVVLRKAPADVTGNL